MVFGIGLVGSVRYNFLLDLFFSSIIIILFYLIKRRHVCIMYMYMYIIIIHAAVEKLNTAAHFACSLWCFSLVLFLFISFLISLCVHIGVMSNKRSKKVPPKLKENAAKEGLDKKLESSKFIITTNEDC